MIAEFLKTATGQGTFGVYTLLFAFTLTKAVLTSKANPHKSRVYGILCLTLGIGLLLISLSLVFSFNSQEYAYFLTKLSV
ncbi:MAG: hypothetical protein KKC20_24985 [Proteobacteria bacterium]|nr:hypothetical protein [Pseudomonadota bacterium]